MFEKPLTIPQMARKYPLPEEFFRSACKRAKQKHRLPHVKSGASRATVYIRPSVFEAWYEEEETL